jgi:Secretion system C-terminal sorting domain
MKKNIFSSLFILFLFLSQTVSSQTRVQGTLVDMGVGNAVRVFGKPNVALTNTLFSNINLAISIPNQGAGNPTNAQIAVTSLIPNMSLTLEPGNPYIFNGRAFYSFVFNDNGGTTPVTWPANSSSPIAEFVFPTNAYFPGMRLYDVPSGGPNSQMYWYVQIIGVGGDVTNYNTMFYGTAGLPPVNTASVDSSWVPLQPISIIPVKFVSFTATKNNNDAVLAWKVDNEDNRTDKYEIERSVNAIDFTKIATVAAKANGQASNSYELTDANLAALVQNANGAIYYRIKQLDKDGRFVYTEIRNIRLSGKSGFSAAVFPNPVKDVATLNVDLSVAADILVYITDAAGKEVQKLTINGAVGGNTKRINMSNLAKGTYVMKVTTGTEVKTLSIVKGQ